MTRELKVELPYLENQSKAWITQVAPGLRAAATSMEELKYSDLQFGLFVMAHEAYRNVVTFIQDRLNEGDDAAEKIGKALHTAFISFDDQQSQQVASTNKLTGEMD